MTRTSFTLAPDRHHSPSPHSMERRCRGRKKKHRRGAGDRFPPAYRHMHELRILAEQQLAEAEEARLTEERLPARPCSVCGRYLVRAKNHPRCGRCRTAQPGGRTSP